jgi:hypothetical protein
MVACSDRRLAEVLFKRAVHGRRQEVHAIAFFVDRGGPMTSDLGAPVVEERLSGYDYKAARSVANFEERIDFAQ